MDSIFDTGPADTIPFPVEPGHRARSRVVVKDAAKATRHVLDATRDGILFEVVSHSVAAVCGIGLFPLIEHGAHVLWQVVVG
jgi:hypothetical protein